MAANFAAGDLQSRTARFLIHFAVPAVVVLLLSLVVDNIVAVVEQPAVLAGMVLEQGLVADVVEDTGMVDALPLPA